tara:strand:- start:238 stop:903 length:666 start_codon:yes stop_codon:yes gene_type:complete
MSKGTCFLILLLVNFLNGQSTNQIRWYETTADYVYNNLSEDYVIPKKIQFESERFLRITKLLNPATGKKSKKAGYPWAVSYNSIVYFNLRYGTSVQLDELYINPDITGRFCVVYADKETLEVIYQFSTQYYGGGLLGVLINDSGKWGRNWKNENDDKIKILIMDTKKLEILNSKGRGNSAWKVLSKDNFNEIFDLNYDKEILKGLDLKEIKEIIDKKNNVG